MRLDRRPVQTRFRCGSPNAWPRRMPQLAGSFYKRHAVTPHGCSDCLQAHGFRCCFTPLSGCFSPFPHGTGSLSVIGECLALEGGPPSFGPGFTCPALLGDALAQGASVRVRGSHWARPLSLAATRGFSVDFSSSGYLDVSVPRVGPAALCVQAAVPGHGPGRVPPFGDPGIEGRLRLPPAYRSLPRPSSPSDAKASAVRPWYLLAPGPHGPGPHACNDSMCYG